MRQSTAMHCNVCDQLLGSALFRSHGPWAITSLARTIEGTTEVFSCGRCGHVQSTALQNLTKYYGSEYRILVDSEEEDQIYEVVDKVRVFRFEHQLRTLLGKLDIPQGALVLDYGCAKSATLRKLVERRPDVRPHFFDVSDDYVEFWARFAPPDAWATHELKSEWREKFDIVTSFFSFEHIDEVGQALHDIASVMKLGAVFYCVVPNLFTNIADFVVVDHINHFTETSLRHALNRAGLVTAEVDANAHRGAFVVVARKAQQATALAEEEPRVPAQQQRSVEDIARFWRDLGSRIVAIEEKLGNRVQSAIYGAGFYGTYIGTCLKDFEKVECFIDQNPFLHGKRLLDKPVLPPDALPRQVNHVYVGLNPAIARNAMQSLDVWRGRNLNYTYLTD